MSSSLVSRIPPQWTKLLRRLHEAGFEDAIIAGGAIRDLDNAKPVKDIDIFLSAPSYDNPDLTDQAMLQNIFARVATAMGVPEDLHQMITKTQYDDDEDLRQAKAREDAGGYQAKRRDVFGVTEFGGNEVGLPGTPVQVIVSRLPQNRHQIMESFDLGLCQISYDGRTTAWTATYEKDKANRTMTVVCCDDLDDLTRIRDHNGRLRHKYPNYKFLLPDSIENELWKNVAVLEPSEPVGPSPDDEDSFWNNMKPF
jgi:hypothetical protein